MVLAAVGAGGAVGAQAVRHRGKATAIQALSGQVGRWGRGEFRVINTPEAADD
jgi:hypothetical protein